MIVTANVRNNGATNTATVATQGVSKEIVIPPKTGAPGSSVNGGELLFLALATCFCNDIFREAAKRNMRIEAVDVQVTGAFGGEGEPARQIEYRVGIEAPRHTSEQITDLVTSVDKIAEIHNTLRQGVAVTLI